MSVNFSQNPQYIKQTQNNNFNGNAPVAEPPLVDAMANSMDLPTKPADMPFLGAAIGFSLLVSKLASWMSRVNPEKNPNLTVAETFNQSAIGKFTSKVDNKVVVPLYRKFMKPLRASQRFLKKYTPEWIKNAGRKMYVGVSPKWNIPKSQFNGLTGQSIDFFFNDVLSQVSPEQLKKLGIDKFTQNLTDMASKKAAFLKIAEKLEKMPASDLPAQIIPRKGLLGKIFPNKKLDLITELNKTKTFVAKNGRTSISRGLQKFLVGSTETAGGAVIGGPFGVLMNSIFVASAFKRTWKAPKEDKFSTFMEALLVDFVGQVYMMFLATKLAYKILGVKNIDKTANQVKRITQLTKAINNKKDSIKELDQIIKAVRKGNLEDDLIKVLIAKNNINPATMTEQSLKALRAKSVTRVNNAIDKLAFAKRLRDNGFWKNLVNRPIKWVGDFMCAGLETTPAKLKEVGRVSGFKAGWQKFAGKFKGLGGAVLRFAFITAVLTPILVKPIVKLTHAIFGKPKNSYYEEYYEKDKKKAEAAKKAKDAQKLGMDKFLQLMQLTGALRAQQDPNMYPKNKNPQISKTLMDRAMGKTPVANYAQTHDTATYVPSTVPSPFTSSLSGAAFTQDKVTYIPSSAPSSFKDDVLQASLQQKLAESVKVEEYVKRELDSIDIKKTNEF